MMRFADEVEIFGFGNHTAYTSISGGFRRNFLCCWREIKRAWLWHHFSCAGVAHKSLRLILIQQRLKLLASTTWPREDMQLAGMWSCVWRASIYIHRPLLYTGIESAMKPRTPQKWTLLRAAAYQKRWSLKTTRCLMVMRWSIRRDVRWLYRGNEMHQHRYMCLGIYISFFFIYNRAKTPAALLFEHCTAKSIYFVRAMHTDRDSQACISSLLMQNNARFSYEVSKYHIFS